MKYARETDLVLKHFLGNFSTPKKKWLCHENSALDQSARWHLAFSQHTIDKQEIKKVYHFKNVRNVKKKNIKRIKNYFTEGSRDFLRGVSNTFLGLLYFQ